MAGPVNSKSKDPVQPLTYYRSPFQELVLSLSKGSTAALRSSRSNGPMGNYDASNPVESSGIVGKNFPFDLRIEALHRFEPGNRVELA